jgi:hypothetical protein
MLMCVDMKNKSSGPKVDPVPLVVSYWYTLPPWSSNVEGTRSRSPTETKGTYNSLYDPFLKKIFSILYK